MALCLGLVFCDYLGSSESGASTVSAQSRRSRGRRRPSRSRGRRTSRSLPDPAMPANLPATGSVSIGRASAGRLHNGVQLTSSTHVHLKSSADHHYGTEELVQLINDSVSSLNQEFPGSRLVVGDLSQQGGGRFRPHRSHRSGRDADIGYLARRTDLSIHPLTRFLRFGRRGAAYGTPGVELDAARHWRLVALMLTHPTVQVQWIFTSRDIKNLLLDEANRVGAPAELRRRADRVLSHPRRGGTHRDHMHVRIYCPPNDLPHCTDDPPLPGRPNATVAPPTDA